MYLVSLPMMFFIFASGVAFGFYAGFTIYKIGIHHACKQGKAFLKRSDGKWFPINPFRQEGKINHETT
jgi:hypothetical protein